MDGRNFHRLAVIRINNHNDCLFFVSALIEKDRLIGIGICRLGKIVEIYTHTCKTGLFSKSSALGLSASVENAILEPAPSSLM